MVRRAAGRALAALTLLGVAAVLAGYGGAVHPAGDSLGVFRWQLALGLVAAAGGLAALGRRRMALGALVVALVAGGPILAARMAAPEPGPVRLYQKNMLAGNPDWQAILADIGAADPDIVTLEEVHRRHDPLVAALRASHPAFLRCARGVHVFSRLPRGEGRSACPEGTGGAVAVLEVEIGGARAWAVAVHQVWPWPWAQAERAHALAEVLAALDAPAIVAGDFNMVPWGRSVRQVAAAGGLRPLGPLVATHHIPGSLLPPLPLDHVLVPEGWEGRVSLRGALGSDHRGVLAEFGPPPAR